MQPRTAHTALPRSVSCNQGNLRYILYLLKLVTFLLLSPVFFPTLGTFTEILHFPVQISCLQPFQLSHLAVLSVPGCSSWFLHHVHSAGPPSTPAGVAGVGKEQPGDGLPQQAELAPGCLHQITSSLLSGGSKRALHPEGKARSWAGVAQQLPQRTGKSCEGVRG